MSRPRLAPHLALRARVVLFTSAIVVAALLLLGSTLHALLAQALYHEVETHAEQDVEDLTGRVAGGAFAAGNQDAVQQLATRLTPEPGSSGPLYLVAVVVVSPERSLSTGTAGYGLDDVPAALTDYVLRTSQLARVYIRNPHQPPPGRLLVFGAPLHTLQGDFQAYFFFSLQAQEDVLSLLSNFILIVGVGLLAAAVVLAVVSIGRVLRPIQRARDVAEEIAAGNLKARIPEATSQDDFGKLAESFNRMTDNLAQKIGELEQLSSLQARFVSDVSHELRTPLATVRMAADYIHAARTGLPPDAQRAAVLLERELERFENLLEDLLEISRFDAGVVVLDPVEVDLAALLDEVIDALDPVAHGRHVEVTLRVDRSDGLPLVAADSRRLERVFSNLVKNAIEHTSEGAVRVDAARRGEQVVVTVEDEGEGIHAEDVPHIFERFYRADPHRARTLGGTGLGLAIALENVHLHGGTIDVTSTVGEGSTFTVILPAAEPQPAVADGDAGDGLRAAARPSAAEVVGG